MNDMFANIYQVWFIDFLTIVYDNLSSREVTLKHIRKWPVPNRNK